MGAGHDHGTAEIKHEKSLWWAFGLTTTFVVAEVIGGLLTNSLALLSDGVDMGTAVIVLAISLVAVRFTREPQTTNRNRRTPDAPAGKRRMVAIDALINGGLLFLGVHHATLQAELTPCEDGHGQG